MSNVKPEAVCLSDFHIGEDLGGVSGIGGSSYAKLEDGVYVRKEFQTLLTKLEDVYGVGIENKIRYLIVMGDQWDLAVQPMPYSSNLSFGFFNNIGLQDYFERIIYIPGNHDHHLWRMYQAQRHLVSPLETIRNRCNDQSGGSGDDHVSDYPQVVAGYLDLTVSPPVLSIGGDSGPDAGISFIGGLTGEACLPVHTVYPNLYVLYQDNGVNKAMLLTHGHLFDPGWNILTDILEQSFGKVAGLPKKLNLKILEMFNSPLTEFWNYSTAQLGKYKLVETMYDQLLHNKFPDLIPDLLKDILDYIKKNTSGALHLAIDAMDTKLIRGLIDDKIKKMVLAGVGSDPRYDQKFIENNKDRFKNYLAMSAADVHRSSITGFARLIYGHTHVPLFGWWPKDLGLDIEVYNTGGWVDIDNTDYPLPLAIAGSGDISAIDISA